MRYLFIIAVTFTSGILYKIYESHQTDKTIKEIIQQNEIRSQSKPDYQKVKLHTASEIEVRKDLDRILHEANIPLNRIHFVRTKSSSKKPEVSIVCNKSQIVLSVSASDTHWGETFYYGLQKLGFLFPHPKIQVSPKNKDLKKHCGKKYIWQPRFEYRGFHLHTQHPNEWVAGFLSGEKEIARETLRWHARNGQNIVQVLILDQPLKKIKNNIQDLILYSQSLGVSFGVDVSFNMVQQKAYRLVSRKSRIQAMGLFQGNVDKELKTSLDELNRALSFDFMTIEIGSSEFTSTDYKKTLKKMNLAGQILESAGRALFIKVHASAGQVHPLLGNYNFLPQYADASVGILPHTVMFFSLSDKIAPVYGRNDFTDMATFLKQESSRRETWYFPETSYFIAMDIDVPLFLTDYLIARSEDMDNVEKWGATGHLNFSTGHELGYWLKDWTVALLSQRDHAGNPYAALDLLGEDRNVWQPIFEFQNKFIKNKGLLEELSSANLLDEIPIGFETHRRNVFRKLRKKPELLKERIALLEEAVTDLPSPEGIKNTELKALLRVTNLRFQQALHLRKALLEEALGQKKSTAWVVNLSQSSEIISKAFNEIEYVTQKFDRYPVAQTFNRHENLTSYPFGYGYPAASLHFWRREEEMIRTGSYYPWFMNLYSIKRIVL